MFTISQNKLSFVVLVGITAVIAAGCASTSPEVAFEQVQADMKKRGVDSVYWYTGRGEDRQVANVIDQWLKEELTLDRAVQIAFLNNRRLQAVYQSLGIAQADLVQAGLLSNPVFGGDYLSPVGTSPVSVGLRVTQSFLEIFYIPMRRRIAESLLEEAKLSVTRTVFDVEYETRVMFYRVQANAQLVEMFEQVVLATESGYDFARRLHAAGNITDLEFNQQRDLFEQARIDQRRAEQNLIHSRERLNQLLGLYGEQIHWNIVGRLPELPEEEINLDRLESRVIEQSLDLVMAAQRITTAGRLLGYTEATALIPWLDVGAEVERDGDWSAGPRWSLPFPLFDQGRARIARSLAELRQDQEYYTAFAVEIRSIAREYRTHLEAARELVRHYRLVLLPLRERITNETQLQYNAMQVGLFELLRARERQIEAGSAYIQALYDYWSVRAALEILVRGRVPRPFETIGGPVPFRGAH